MQALLKKKVLVAPSLLSADFAHLADAIAEVEDAGADWLHLDIMDGHFVPNITFGAPVIAAIRKVTNLPLDVHLMISDPLGYAPNFADAGSDYLTFHLEAVENVSVVIAAIRDLRVKPGLSIRPGTPVSDLYPYLPDIELALIMSVEPGFGGQKYMPEASNKVSTLRTVIDDLGTTTLIEVDGGITAETAPSVIESGVDVLVAGTAVFGSDDYATAISLIRGE